MQVKVAGLTIKDFGCIEYRVVEIGPDGVEIRGPNGSGKTSIGDSLEATLVGKGISKDCIRTGANRSEVIVRCDASPDPSFTVRQTVPREGQAKLVVKNDKGDTRPWPSPREKLIGIFGSLFDPSEFLTADKAKRLKMLTEIVPMPVTEADLERWTGEKVKLLDGEHGLEAIDRVRAIYVAERSTAKNDLKTAEGAAAAAADKLEKLASPAHAGVVVPLIEDEEKPLGAARQALRELEIRAEQAKTQEAKIAGSRQQIADLRSQAEAIKVGGPFVPPLSERIEIDDAVKRWAGCIEELERELQKARDSLKIWQDKSADYVAREKAGHEATAEMERKIHQATTMEANLDAALVVAPTEAEIESARQNVAKEEAHLVLVRAARAEHDAVVASSEMLGEVEAAKREVKRLDSIIERLTREAPAEMVKRTEAIPGLAVIDGGIFLDGVAFDRCGGAEQRRFVVDLAKRANPNGKLIKMDEVGALDDRTRVALYEEITKDGWAVIALRPWCDPEKDITEPVVVPISEAVAEVKVKKPRLTIVDESEKE